MTEIVAADVGGTHARFALAEVAEGRVAALGEPCTLATADHAGLEDAWAEFARRIGRPLPAAAAIAVAAPIEGETIKLTNNPWTIARGPLPGRLGVSRLRLVNDFGAVGHAVAQLDPVHFRPLCGPDRPLPEEGLISIVGPGTGLGVAQLLRRVGRAEVIETEGGHIGFAPADAFEDALAAGLRARFGRVSVERIVSGAGLAIIYRALAAAEGRTPVYAEDKALWAAALAGEDALAGDALERFCGALGAAAGDIALAHGAAAVTIGGGLGLRLADRLPRSSFRERFVAKGRYQQRMERMPVRIVTHGQPGLYGAAAAFAALYPD